MLQTDGRRLIRIPIQTICYQGWSATFDGHVIELDHFPDGIAVTTDRYTHPIRWRVYERVITNLGYLHEFERKFIRQRCDEGIEGAKARSTVFDRKPVLDAGERVRIAERYAAG